MVPTTAARSNPDQGFIVQDTKNSSSSENRIQKSAAKTMKKLMLILGFGKLSARSSLRASVKRAAGATRGKPGTTSIRILPRVTTRQEGLPAMSRLETHRTMPLLPLFFAAVSKVLRKTASRVKERE